MADRFFLSRLLLTKRAQVRIWLPTAVFQQLYCKITPANLHQSPYQRWILFSFYLFIGLSIMLQHHTFVQNMFCCLRISAPKPNKITD